MRMMSFRHTTRQLLDGSKTVTRRPGWTFLKPGDRFIAVVQARGLKRGQKVEKLGECVVVSNRRERVGSITAADVVREGFDGVLRAVFVDWFCRTMKVRPSSKVSRIEFRRAGDHPSPPAARLAPDPEV